MSSTATGKKGKKKAKGTTISLTDFLGDAAPPAAAAVKNIDWADESEDIDGSDLTYQSSYNNKQILSSLPTGPRSSRSIEVDMSKLPNEPPFTAFVGNLPYEADEEMLREFFKDLKVISVRLPEENGRFRGYGYVEFADKQSLAQALQHNEETFNKRQIRVDVAGSKNQDSRRGNRYGGQGFGGGGFDGPDVTEGEWRRKPDEAFQPPQSNRGHVESDYRSDGRRGYGDHRHNRYDDRDSHGQYGRRRYEDRYYESRGYSRGDSYGSDDRGYDGNRGYGGYRDRGYGGNRYDRGYDGDQYGRDRGYGERGYDRDRGYGGGRDRGYGGDRYNGDRDYDGDRGYDRNRYGGSRGYGGDRGYGEDRGFRRDHGYDRGSGYSDRGSGYGDRGGYRDDRSYGRDRGYYQDDRRDNYDSRYSDDRGSDRQNSHDLDRRPSSEQTDSPHTRPTLKLQPRTVPVETNAPSERSSAIFGSAKPVDTASREKAIEEKLQAETTYHVKDERAKRAPRRSSEQSDDGQPSSPRRVSRRKSSDKEYHESNRRLSTSPGRQDDGQKHKDYHPAPPPRENAWNKRPSVERDVRDQGRQGDKREEQDKQEVRKPNVRPAPPPASNPWQRGPPKIDRGVREEAEGDSPEDALSERTPEGADDMTQRNTSSRGDGSEHERGDSGNAHVTPHDIHDQKPRRHGDGQRDEFKGSGPPRRQFSDSHSDPHESRHRGDGGSGKRRDGVWNQGRDPGRDQDRYRRRPQDGQNAWRNDRREMDDSDRNDARRVKGHEKRRDSSRDSRPECDRSAAAGQEQDQTKGIRGKRGRAPPSEPEPQPVIDFVQKSKFSALALEDDDDDVIDTRSDS